LAIFLKMTSYYLLTYHYESYFCDRQREKKFKTLMFLIGQRTALLVAVITF
jgi:hypothetical protein